MAGRGGGRGRGFPVLGGAASLFAGNVDPSIGPLLQPPPTYPSTDKKPTQLTCDVDTEYLLLMDRVYLDYFTDFTSELFTASPSEPSFLYSNMPTELQPMVKAKRVVIKTNLMNADAELDRLEKLERKTEDVEQHAEDQDALEDVDEEMDEGTDYAHDYFDNGEMYEENDDGDNLPVY